jgi:cytochrome b6-f complex iron-sulfur subunit
VDLDQQRQTRRAFCVGACQALSAIAFGGVLGTFLESCTKDNPLGPSAANLPQIQATTAAGSVSVAIASNSPLAAVGSAATVLYQGGVILVAHTAQNTFTALSAICTHQGCTITGFTNRTYVCPCHGSQFNTNGQVVMGPATIPLQQFPTTFANNTLTIKV